MFELSKIIDQFRYHADAPLLFSSGFFLFFFLVFFFGYQNLLTRQRLRMVWVTAFSLFFYYKCAGLYWILLVAGAVIDFYLARLISKTESKFQKKWLLVGSLVLNFGMLGYFKYTNFLIEIWNNFTAGQLAPMDIFLPVGISFFTFQSMSYTIDVYRGELKPLDKLLDYAFFVTFFPQMVAGPIVRASVFLPQIHRTPFVSEADLGRGVFLFCSGLFKKVVVSDYLSLNFVDRVFDDPTKYTGLENLIGIYGYALQIYCDFSGYSDMAIGIALLIGFSFPINFDSPYQSKSVTEFWRRWHISLSTWLRDYLYIPLGGNRKGKWKTYRNLLITMLLGGLWHGAATRFIIWGGLHGLALAVEKFFKENIKLPAGKYQNWLGWFWTFHFVCFCWIFFRAKDLATVRAILSQIFTAFHPEIFVEFLRGYSGVAFWILVGFVLHFCPRRWEIFSENWVSRLPILGKAALLFAFILLVMQAKSSEVQPFIYFQF